MAFTQPLVSSILDLYKANKAILETANRMADDATESAVCICLEDCLSTLEASCRYLGLDYT